MLFYWIKTNRFIKKLFPRYMWEIPSVSQVYLTFDDGPVPEVTPWVLDQLKLHDAKATFFCIGENIRTNPEIFQRIIAEGHAIGNHTYNHLNGWQTKNSIYLENVRLFEKAAKETANIKTVLFRPPYGKIKKSQAEVLLNSGYKIVMWDVLSADFDQRISASKCTQNVVGNVKPGSIVIFHDSHKAFANLKQALPATLEHLKINGLKSDIIR